MSKQRTKLMKILLTGGSGMLGTAIRNSGIFSDILAPSHEEIDIKNYSDVREYIKKTKLHGIIHCAAISKRASCENDPDSAIHTNMIGTANLVRAVTAEKKNLRFLYISTDAVYGGGEGKYKEDGPTIPSDNYGWTKLGGECATRTLLNSCIVRTSFFDPKNIPFESASDTVFFSKLPINDLVGYLFQIYASNLKGVINVGQEKISAYQLYHKYKSSIKKITPKMLQEEGSVSIAKDLSLDISCFKNLHCDK